MEGQLQSSLKACGELARCPQTHTKTQRQSDIQTDSKTDRGEGDMRETGRAHGKMYFFLNALDPA